MVAQRSEGVIRMKVCVGLRSLTDEEISFIKQIGVDDVDLGVWIIPEHQVGGRLGSLENFSRVFRKIRSAGLNIECFRTCSDDFSIRNFLLGKPEGKRELDEQCKLIRFLGEESVPIAHIAVGSSAGGVRGGPARIPGRFQKGHRGGYMADAFDLALMRRQLAVRNMNAPWANHFMDKLTREDYWSHIVQAYEKIIPIAEEANVKIAIHTDDPPVPDIKSLLPGIQDPLKFNRLFDAVPSKNSGLLFCIGQRYESGIDIYEQIRIFGRKGKIFHVHFRNVRGTLPSSGAYEEVMLDDGDMDMFRVLQALDRVGYDGCLNPDHYPVLDKTADPNGNAGMAWSVGYIKALLSALPSYQKSR